MDRLAVLVALLSACSFQARDVADGQSATCGNGVLDPGEACDTGIAGSCPTSCDDGVACTSDTLDGAACSATCRHDPITAAANSDGCCPAGATSATDNDCSVTCGNGTVESNETCDTAIASGPGACPTSCDDRMACTADTLVSAGTCQAACTHDAITAAMNGDGCCPAGATYATDSDCPAPTAFRITTLSLRDPHPFVNFMGCNDAIGIANGTNQDPIDHDRNNDGYFDSSTVLVFRPLVETNNSTTPLDTYFNALCTATSTTCKPGAIDSPTTATSLTSGTCLAALAGTTKPYNPAVSPSAAPCFSSSAVDITVPAFGAMVPLKQVQIAATYGGTTTMTSGLLRGFLTQTDAEATTVQVGALSGSLASFLPGGQGNCSSGTDKDMLNATSGWWIYYNFTASAVPWTEQ